MIWRPGCGRPKVSNLWAFIKPSIRSSAEDHTVTETKLHGRPEADSERCSLRTIRRRSNELREEYSQKQLFYAAAAELLSPNEMTQDAALALFLDAKY